MFEAIRNGLLFLSFDELPSDERPPRNIWLDLDELRKWFKAVEQHRKRKYGLESDKMSDEPIDGPEERNDVKAILGMG